MQPESAKVLPENAKVQLHFSQTNNRHPLGLTPAKGVPATENFGRTIDAGTSVNPILRRYTKRLPPLTAFQISQLSMCLDTFGGSS